MGWGVDNGIKYWLVQDSYGISKGENGFIKILIGDDCGAGVTAFCDEIEGKYNVTQDNNMNTNSDYIINGDSNNNNESQILNDKNNMIYILFFFLFLL